MHGLRCEVLFLRVVHFAAASLQVRLRHWCVWNKQRHRFPVLMTLPQITELLALQEDLFLALPKAAATVSLPSSSGFRFFLKHYRFNVRDRVSFHWGCACVKLFGGSRFLPRSESLSSVPKRGEEQVIGLFLLLLLRPQLRVYRLLRVFMVLRFVVVVVVNVEQLFGLGLCDVGDFEVEFVGLCLALLALATSEIYIDMLLTLHLTFTELPLLARRRNHNKLQLLGSNRISFRRVPAEAFLELLKECPLPLGRLPTDPLKDANRSFALLLIAGDFG